jgi:hypothetical protein
MFVEALIGQQEAEVMMSGKKGLLLKTGRNILRTELLFLPVYIFTVSISDTKGKINTETVSVDGIRGEFAAYKGKMDNLRCGDEKNQATFRIAEPDARKTAGSEYGRLVFRHNLRHPDKLRIAECSVGRKIYYPYWIGYFRRRRGFDFLAVDAVGGAFQGARMKSAMIDLILHKAGNQKNS